MIGVSEYTDFPSQLIKKNTIGPYHQFSVERVISLKPDLVLATLDGNPKDRVLRLREMGIPVVVVDTESFKEIENAILLVATSLGESASGKKIVQQLRLGLDRFRKKAIARKPIKVLLQVGSDPIVIAGKKSFLNACLELLGAKNLYEDLHLRYPRPSMEDIISKNPDIILIAALGKEMSPYVEMAKKWNQFSRLQAVKMKRVHVLKSDELLRPTLRILEGLSKLERILDEPL
jgi:ABC-type Fe3+-hydroxamate transport system substrate-binding protein